MIYHEHKSAYVIIGEVHVVKNTVSEPKILFLHVEVKKKKKKSKTYRYRYMKDDS